MTVEVVLVQPTVSHTLIFSMIPSVPVILQFTTQQLSWKQTDTFDKGAHQHRKIVSKPALLFN